MSDTAPPNDAAQPSNLLQAVFERLADPVVVLDDDARVVLANESAREALGPDLVGRGLFDVLSPDEPSDELWREFLRSGRAQGTLELRGGGVPLTFEHRSTARVHPGLHVSVLRDVTPWEHALEAGQIGTWIADLATDAPLRWSRRCFLMFGLPPQRQLSRDQYLSLAPPEDRERILAAAIAAQQHGGRLDVEHRILRPDGEIRSVRVRGVLERDRRTEDPVRWIGTVQDVTVERRSRQRLKASEERYRRLIEGTREGLVVFDGAGLIVLANRQMGRMVGLAPTEMIGRTLGDLVAPADRDSVNARVQRTLEGEVETFDVTFTRDQRPGALAHLRATPLALDDGTVDGVMALVSDVTEQRRTELERLRLAAMVESAGDAFVAVALDGTIGSWNRGAELLLGWPSADSIGKPITSIVPERLWGDEQRIHDAVVKGGRVEQVESTWVRKSGAEVPVALTISPIFDGRGKLVGTSRLARDLTETRKVQEALRQSEERLRQAQKLEALGALAGGVAHDFNNLLSVISSFSAILLEDLPMDDVHRGDVEEIVKASTRAADLTRQLLAISRKQVMAPRVIDVNALVTGIERMLRRVLDDKIQFALDLSPRLGKTFADSGQIEQVVMNLVLNARDAMPEGGTLLIATYNESLSAERALTMVNARPGDYVVLSVQDTGLGMTREVQERIFEPFFTTKEPGRGTGLGLSTVLGIVSQSEGHVVVHSAPNKGARFEVYLPRTDKGMEAALRRSTASMPAFGRETVLVVDDEEQVRHAIQTILSRRGYVVLEATGPADALLVAEQHGGDIDLLLTDVVMPRMTGTQLAARLLEQRPTMKVLFVTGYANVGPDRTLGSDANQLQKPIAPEPLLVKVREVLDQDGG